MEQERETAEKTMVVYGPVSYGTGDAISGDSVKIKTASQKKKGLFEKYWFPLILVIIAGLFNIYKVILDEKHTPVSAPNLPTSISTIIVPSLAPIETSTQSPTSTYTPTSCSFLNGPITVGVIDLGVNYLYTDILTRLTQIGLIPIPISASATYNVLAQYKIIYLPSGWAIKKAGLDLNSKAYLDFVQKHGGGLLVEQANSDAFYTPSFLPFSVNYKEDNFNRDDWPLDIVNSSTIFTKGIDASELPGPMDCAELDSAYMPIVKGNVTGCTSLAITLYGEGRILLSMGNASPSMEKGYLISDSELCRMFGWLAKEY
ncbi:MAG: hypothetical protein AB9907_00360 [Flexilinea sp.]